MGAADDRDDYALGPGIAHQRLDRRLAAVIDAFAVVLGQQGKAGKVSEPVVDDAIDLAGRDVLAMMVVPMTARRRRPVGPPGRGLDRA